MSFGVLERICSDLEKLIQINKDQSVLTKSDPSLYRVGWTDGRNAGLSEALNVVASFLRNDEDGFNSEVLKEDAKR